MTAMVSRKISEATCCARFQQHDDLRAASSESGDAPGVSLVSDSQFRPGACPAGQTCEAKPGFEQALDGAIESSLESSRFLTGERESGKFGAQLKSFPLSTASACSLFESENETVALMEVADGPTVRDNAALGSPIVAQSVKEKVLAHAGSPRHSVVRAHDRIGLPSMMVARNAGV